MMILWVGIPQEQRTFEYSHAGQKTNLQARIHLEQVPLGIQSRLMYLEDEHHWNEGKRNAVC